MKYKYTVIPFFILEALVDDGKFMDLDGLRISFARLLTV